MEDDVTIKVADNAQVSLSPEIVARRTTVKSRKGDTVTVIAKRYDLTAANVAEWNSVGLAAAFKLGHPIVLFLPLKSRAVTNSGSDISAGRNKKKGQTVQAVKRGASKPVVKKKHAAGTQP